MEVVQTNSAGFGIPSSERAPKSFENELKRNLSSFDLEFKCESNSDHYTLVLKDVTRYAWLKTGWLILSAVTAGIIPAFTTFETDVVFKNGNDILSEGHITIDRAVWIFYIYKMFKDDSRSYSLYDSDTFRAAYAKQLSGIIWKGIENKK